MADVLSSRESMPSLGGKALRESQILEEDSAAAGKSKKGSPFTEAEIFQMACELSDQGFGEFDVCLTVLTAKKGNIKLAKNALSKVIFSQQKGKS